jgi:hypothetical protein
MLLAPVAMAATGGAAHAATVISVTPGQSSIGLQFGVSPELTLNLLPSAGPAQTAGAASTATVTSNCAHCTYSWVVPTDIGLMGGSTYSVSVSCGVSTCAQQQLTQISIAPTYCRPFPELAQTNFTDGGHKTSYDVDGSTLTEAYPPSGFDPSSASASELVRYSIPPPPANSTDMASWNETYANYKGNHATAPCTTDALSVGMGEADPSLTAPATGAPGEGAKTGTMAVTSPTWAGQLAYHTGGSYFTSVSATFVQRPNEIYSCPPPEGQSTWVGLGGFHDTDISSGYWNLMQDGTAADTTFSPNQIYPWYEEIEINPSTGATIHDTGEILLAPKGSVSVGDTVKATTTYEASSTNINYTVTVNGTPYSATESNAAKYFDDPIEAEAITERPYDNVYDEADQLMQLGPQDNVTFSTTNATLHSGTSQKIGEYDDHLDISMRPSGTNSAGNTYPLDAAYDGAPVSFAVDWDHCGPNGHNKF